MSNELDAMADAVIAAMKGYVSQRIDPLLRHIEELLAREIPTPKAEVIDAMARMVRAAVAEAITLLPPPKDGIDGKDAEPVDIDGLRVLLVDEIIKAVGDLPPAKNGDPGKDGEPGKEGSPGKDGTSIVVGDVEPLILEAVSKSVASLPAAERGLPGERGDPGKDGMSVTLVDVEPMLTAAVSKAVSEASELTTRQLTDSMPASFLIDDEGDLLAIYPAGNKEKVGHVRGKDGRHGSSIMDGSVDDGGQLILRMSDGRVINAGTVKGAQGESGISIKGEPGRDAIDQTILSSIDENTSYPARTCATYRSGTIRAVRDTDPIVDGDVLKAGWIVLMGGIAEQTEQHLDDGRVIERRLTYTSGKSVVFRHDTSMMIYRDVWKQQEYKRGDNVTFGGSTWHCNRTTTEKPGESDAWRLTTKRGRDGKDAPTGLPSSPPQVTIPTNKH